MPADLPAGAGGDLASVGALVRLLEDHRRRAEQLAARFRRLQNEERSLPCA